MLGYCLGINLTFFYYRLPGVMGIKSYNLLLLRLGNASTSQNKKNKSAIEVKINFILFFFLSLSEDLNAMQKSMLCTLYTQLKNLNISRDDLYEDLINR